MTKSICSTCNQPLGTNGSCEACLQYKMQQEAQGINEQEARKTADNADEFMKKPPWYARFMPSILWIRFLLLLQMLKDAMNGKYELSGIAIAMIVFAIAYVVSPVDLIPDVLIPVGWTDDALVVALLFKNIEHDLKNYIKVMGLDASKYNFEP